MKEFKKNANERRGRAPEINKVDLPAGRGSVTLWFLCEKCKKLLMKLFGWQVRVALLTACPQMGKSRDGNGKGGLCVIARWVFYEDKQWKKILLKDSNVTLSLNP